MLQPGLISIALQLLRGCRLAFRVVVIATKFTRFNTTHMVIEIDTDLQLTLPPYPFKVLCCRSRIYTVKRENNTPLPCYAVFPFNWKRKRNKEDDDSAVE